MVLLLKSCYVLSLLSYAARLMQSFPSNLNMQITPWLTSLGYSLCFGIIMAKMFRVFYIFANPTLQKKIVCAIEHPSVTMSRMCTRTHTYTKFTKSICLPCLSSAVYDNVCESTHFTPLYKACVIHSSGAVSMHIKPFSNWW